MIDAEADSINVFNCSPLSSITVFKRPHNTIGWLNVGAAGPSNFAECPGDLTPVFVDIAADAYDLRIVQHIAAECQFKNPNGDCLRTDRTYLGLEEAGTKNWAFLGP